MKSPFVSRLAFDQAVIRAEVAERQLETVRTSATLQINVAFEQSNKSIEQAREAIRDARAAINQALEMSKLAHKSMFGAATDDILPPPTSVAENDRKAAQKRRETGR